MCLVWSVECRNKISTFVLIQVCEYVLPRAVGLHLHVWLALEYGEQRTRSTTTVSLSHFPFKFYIVPQTTTKERRERAPNVSVCHYCHSIQFNANFHLSSSKRRDDDPSTTLTTMTMTFIRSVAYCSYRLAIASFIAKALK